MSGENRQLEEGYITQTVRGTVRAAAWRARANISAMLLKRCDSAVRKVGGGNDEKREDLHGPARVRAG